MAKWNNSQLMAVLLRCCWENLSSGNIEVDHYCVFWQMLNILLGYKNLITHSPRIQPCHILYFKT